ncbi:MAG: putative ABC transporter permease [Clostridia bacterium]|nr:putative ABC transporter permease [Clostridia bacterium]
MEKIKNVKLFNISIVRLFAYFLIYGFIGFIIESIFGMITKGVLESRTSFVNSPICGIYGIGATLMIIALQKYKNSNKKMFLVAFLVGTITEYSISFLAEVILHVKWWDYSENLLNINGRVCLYYSIFWGFLGLFLIKVLNPRVNKLLEYIKKKIPEKKLGIIVKIVIIYFIIDLFMTWISIDMFTTRMIAKNDIPVKNKEAIIQKYDKIYSNKPLADFIYTFFGDERMIKTYPNIKVQDEEGKQIYLDMYLKDIKPYFIKIYDKKLY